MKAILFEQPGGPEVLHWGDMPTPTPGDRELLVRVHATALNRADVLQRRGHYPPPSGESPVLGLEIAGEVIETGAAVKAWKAGSRICGLVGGGGYAEYALIHEDMAMPVPEGWTWEEAAAIPEAFLTAWQSLVFLGKMAAGERVLIHAGASGVGTAAIQLARALQGGEIWVTASAPKHALCRELGATHAIDYRNQDFLEEIRREKGPSDGIDLIVDCIGAPYFQRNLEALQMDGRLVMLAMMGGAQTESANLMPLLRKRLHVLGTTLRNRSLEYKIELTQSFHSFAWPLFAAGRLRPVIDRVLPIEEAAQAHALMESNQNQGKLILFVQER